MSDPQTEVIPEGERPHRRLERLWEQGQRPDVDAFLASAGVTGAAEVAAALAVDQWRRWRAGERVPAEDYLARHPRLAAEPEAALELICGELLVREELGERPGVEEYLRRFPSWADRLRQQFAVHRALASEGGPPTLATPSPSAATWAPPIPSSSWGGPPAEVRRLPAVPGYEILGEVGQGGMGVVYQARHLRLKRAVALKMIKAGVLAQASELARFRGEAEAVARLQHPHIVQIYEIGEHAGGPFLALEFVGGGSLAERLRGEPLPLREAAQLVETLARAVHYAHERGIVHRDLKPANVLLASGGREPPDGSTESGGSRPPLAGSAPKITDFGLAKQLDTDQGQTQSGVVMGTPGYMAPEQAAGRAKDVGPAADVWALGVILYECLTGRQPFLADTAMDTLLRVLNTDPAAPRRLRPAVPRDLETITLKCLRKEPGKRYASAAELADDLARFLNHEPIRARPVGAAERALRWVRRRAAVVLMGLLVLVALGSAAGGLWLWQRWQDEQGRASEARRRAEERARVQASVSVGYFANMTRRRGEPEGVEPLTEAEARRRYTAYKVSSRGGAVEQVEVLNTPEAFHRWNPVVALTAGEGDDNSAATHAHRLTRDEHGRLVEETARDAAGKLLWRLRYAGGGLARYTDDKLYPDTDDAPRTAYLRFVWDGRGFAREIWWADRNGRPRESPSGVYGVRLAHDPRGLRERITYLDADGRPTRGRDGTAARALRHDARANPVEEACFDTDGRPVRCADGYHKWKTRHDDRGNQVELTFYDAGGKPAAHRSGYHRFTCRYDGRGHMIDSRTFDADGKPVVTTWGYARLTRTYDGQGAYQGQTRWVVDRKGGYVASSRLNAAGKTVESAHFAPDGEPARHAHGYHRWTANYDARGNTLEVACFGLDGKPTAQKDGWHRWAARYDELDHLVETTYFDADGKPVVTKAGYARLTSAYAARGAYVGQTEWIPDGKGGYVATRRLDPRGKVLELALFTRDGRPRAHADGYHRWAARYDDRGNHIEKTYFDLAGKPTTHSDGYHGWKARHDERGNAVETSYFGPDGKPTLTRQGYHLYRARFDERSNRVEGSWFGVDGRPLLHRDGDVHKLLIRYDGHGRECEALWFGVDGRPTLHKREGAARRTQRYDAAGGCVEKAYYVLDDKGAYALSRRVDGRGKILEQAYFTPDGRPNAHASGYHRWTGRYDEYGHTVEVAYFGLDGKPMTLPDRYHRWTGRNDERGNRLELAYFDTEGRPTTHEWGNHRWVNRYDERNNRVEERFFGVDGRPVVVKHGYARLERAYDEQGFHQGLTESVLDERGAYVVSRRLDARGNVLEEAFFAADGKPQLRSGYHRATIRYDARGKKRETAYYGIGNKPLLRFSGYHKVTTRYNDRGQLTELAWFGLQGEPVVHKVDRYHKLAATYDNGRRVETAYFGTDGRPVLSKFGYARLASVKDENGRPTDQVGYDVAGKPVPLQLVIDRVEGESQAEGLGLRAGDVLRTYNGKAVPSLARLDYERRGETADGPPRELRVRRGDRTLAVEVSAGPLGVTLSTWAAANR